MPDQRTETPKSTADLKVRPRRNFLTKALGLGAGAVGLAAASQGTARAQAGPSDADILQFALNLEYLEAEYYTYGVTGQSIEALGISTDGAGNHGPVIIKNNPKVPFVDQDFAEYFTEVARDEQKHVLFLREALAAAGVEPVARPTIDLLNSFNLAAQLAGLGNSFDPFASEINFLIGAYIFEDVGVTAYHGAAPLLTNKAYLSAAAGILGTEAYHAGEVRLLMFQNGQGPASRKISRLRAAASHENDDYGVDQGPNGTTSIVLVDENALVYARTFRQVLNIVYLNPNNPPNGGFFPNGLNGAIH